MNPRLLVTTMKSGKEYILCLATPAPPQRNFPQWFVGNVVWSPVANYSWTQALCTNLLHNGRDCAWHSTSCSSFLLLQNNHELMRTVNHTPAQLHVYIGCLDFCLSLWIAFEPQPSCSSQSVNGYQMSDYRPWATSSQHFTGYFFLAMTYVLVHTALTAMRCWSRNGKSSNFGNLVQMPGLNWN